MTYFFHWKRRFRFIRDQKDLQSLALSNNTIEENSPENTVVGTLSNHRFDLSLHDSAGDRFKLSGDNIVAGPTSTDYETAQSHSITVRETSEYAIKDSVFTINVTDVTIET